MGGRTKTSGQGRPKGSKNKVTKTVKEAFEAAFRQAQNLPGVKLSDWMKDNPTEFYKIAARLIPAEIQGKLEHEHKAPSMAVVSSALGIPQSALAAPRDAGHTPAPNKDK